MNSFSLKTFSAVLALNFLVAFVAYGYASHATPSTENNRLRARVGIPELPLSPEQKAPQKIETKARPVNKLDVLCEAMKPQLENMLRVVESGRAIKRSNSTYKALLEGFALLAPCDPDTVPRLLRLFRESKSPNTQMIAFHILKLLNSLTTNRPHPMASSDLAEAFIHVLQTSTNPDVKLDILDEMRSEFTLSGGLATLEPVDGSSWLYRKSDEKSKERLFLYNPDSLVLKKTLEWLSENDSSRPVQGSAREFSKLIDRLQQ